MTDEWSTYVHGYGLSFMPYEIQRQCNIGACLIQYVCLTPES